LAASADTAPLGRSRRAKLRDIWPTFAARGVLSSLQSFRCGERLASFNRSSCSVINIWASARRSVPRSGCAVTIGSAAFGAVQSFLLRRTAAASSWRAAIAGRASSRLLIVELTAAGSAIHLMSRRRHDAVPLGHHLRPLRHRRRSMFFGAMALMAAIDPLLLPSRWS
jgi:hypothetical protein